MNGYRIELDGREYVAWRDGRPFSLVDAWREVEGVAGARILAPTGRVVLDNAGSTSARVRHIARAVTRNACARGRQRVTRAERAAAMRRAA